MKIQMRFLAAWLVLGAAATAMTACGTSAAGLCDAKCECEGCSQRDNDECLAEADGDEREADFRNCWDYYDDLLACQDATGYCDGSDWKTSCNPERDRYKNCVK